MSPYRGQARSNAYEIQARRSLPSEAGDRLPQPREKPPETFNTVSDFIQRDPDAI
jgi:hypothetical protein